jgi:aryl-alcohol dehydrogenase-like predicted oxidoreductase
MPSQPHAAKSHRVRTARMDLLRHESIVAVRELEETVVRMRNHLKSLETGLRRAHRMLENGRLAREIAGSADFAGGRRATSALMHEIQAARHRAQRAQFQLAAAEGSSMADIARAWGVSRQLVSRMVKEPMSSRKKA